MKNIVVALLLVVIIAGIIYYLVRAKKRGDKCIGCPYAKECGKSNDCSCK